MMTDDDAPASHLTRAERYIHERLKDPEYAAAYFEARRRFQMEDELEVRAFPLSLDRMCYLRIPTRLTPDDVLRLTELIMSLAAPDEQEPASEWLTSCDA